jgi:hypothetical protein
MFASAGIKCPQIQLGAENNIEKSRCLAQMRKKIRAAVRAWHWFFRLLRRYGLSGAAPFTVISGM